MFPHAFVERHETYISGYPSEQYPEDVVRSFTYCTVRNGSAGGWGVTPPIRSGGAADGHTARGRAATGGRTLPYLVHIRPKMGPNRQ